ncbi:DUF481 domain-containing protein [Aureitalea marina]|uniref:DUF481 domain-containing protein n=1 Tax=Aureitalea marina TaxID=930804 RepID=A0A2S7KLP9_9FLAO|nr:DUF481 domain-containing protein [Aureitalea marina]PQB03528.1 hypothetical protein BST85_00415 [Aureitalea marina]
MRYFLGLLLFASLSYSVQAQILNVENLRKVTDTAGFSGYIGLEFSLVRNVNEFFGISNDLLVQYKKGNHLALLRNNVNFLKIDGEDFANNGITHLRYNYKFRPMIRWEFFAQAQYNRVALIDFRGLLGTGPRFKLSEKEKYKIYIGTLVMYEYEELSDGTGDIFRDVRGSAYLSISLYPNDRMSFVSTTYYQPLFRKLNDYRISSDSTFSLDIIDKLLLSITYRFFYDPFPAQDIPTSQYRFSTGLTYTFD